MQEYDGYVPCKRFNTYVDREKAFLDREVVGNSRARRIPACMHVII